MLRLLRTVLCVALLACLSWGILGCSSSQSPDKDRMGRDRTMMDDKMGKDRMADDKMGKDRMMDDKMGKDRMAAEKK
jgi:hypothetical protein